MTKGRHQARKRLLAQLSMKQADENNENCQNGSLGEWVGLSTIITTITITTTTTITNYGRRWRRGEGRGERGKRNSKRKNRLVAAHIYRHLFPPSTIHNSIIPIPFLPSPPPPYPTTGHNPITLEKFKFSHLIKILEVWFIRIL